MTPDEYQAIARRLAADIGIDLFDDTTYQPHRLMFWPSTAANGEYVFDHQDGPAVDPDKVLARYPDWIDQSYWPESSRAHKEIKKAVERLGDPTEKKGVVGAFCRTYGITAAISTFLSDVYEPCGADDRYTFVGGTSAAGLVVYADKHVHSHHSTDPLSGMSVNSFDMVRIHKFGELDADIKPGEAPNKYPSWKAMLDFALSDPAVKMTIAEERLAEAVEDFSDIVEDDKAWLTKLEYDKKGLLVNNLHNIVTILKNDKYMKSLVFNQLADGIEIKGAVPWGRDSGCFWRDADDAQLMCYVDASYGTFSMQNYQTAITKVTDDRSYHPVREYLDNLPAWDGVERVDTLLIKYLKAQDNPYVRAVTRKTLCAAIARVFRPSIKFDTVLVLNGPQGVGKSTLMQSLGNEIWFSDSLTLTDMCDKTAAEKLQGYWILEIPEMSGIRKADIEKVKAFISRQDDKYRASFGRRVTSHPRQNIIFGTTNSENGYLWDITGNRRFWTVKTPGEGKKATWTLTREEVQQIWAEVLTYVAAGEKLYLDSELIKLAKIEEREAMERDEREGVVLEYLERLLPDEWENMSVFERRQYIMNPDDSTLPVGVHERKTVSNMEIWCECFGRKMEDIKSIDSYAITAIMVYIQDWKKSGRYKRLKHYGLQRYYIKSR